MPPLVAVKYIKKHFITTTPTIYVTTGVVLEIITERTGRSFCRSSLISSKTQISAHAITVRILVQSLLVKLTIKEVDQKEHWDILSWWGMWSWPLSSIFKQQSDTLFILQNTNLKELSTARNVHTGTRSWKSWTHGVLVHASHSLSKYIKSYLMRWGC